VINLAEIELYTGSNSNYVKIPNSALTCTMSTTGYGLTVDKCFDGITNSDSNMCHTDGTPNFGEYLTCIVAGGYSVSMVKVYNRYSSYTHELQRINNANLIYSRYSDGRYAFYLCSSLVSVTIPASVTNFGNLAFYSTPFTCIIDWDTTITRTYGDMALDTAKRIRCP